LVFIPFILKIIDENGNNSSTRVFYKMNQHFSEQIKHELEFLWRFALRLSNDKMVAEELVQKTILRSLEKQHQYEQGSKLRSWLFKILHSIWKNDLRKQSIRAKVDFSPVDIDCVESNAESAEQSLFFKQVIKQVNLLPEAQRTALILVCVDGYSYKETSQILDVPEGTVMSRVARARLKVGKSFLQNENKKNKNKRVNAKQVSG